MNQVQEIPQISSYDDIKKILNKKLENQPQVNSWDEFPEPRQLKGVEEAANLFINKAALKSIQK